MSQFPRNYDRRPRTDIPGLDGQSWRGWEAARSELAAAVARRATARTVIFVECYPGVETAAIIERLAATLRCASILDTETLLRPPAELDRLLEPDLGGDDPVFGFLTRRTLADYLEPGKLAAARHRLAQAGPGLHLVAGPGSLLTGAPDILVYADLPRWEIQLRQRRGEIGNLGADNRQASPGAKYKRAFFTDWRAADRLKRETFERWDYLLDTTLPADPRLATGTAFREALRACTRRPFRLVPFFDPGPWGGQWMKEAFGLEPTPPNYAWCFDCVPEENSLLLGMGGIEFEVPALDLVLYCPEELLGAAVYSRFGAEFPIRFDLLDTMGGGNLSFQVHPATDYIREQFGFHYTQDESYYLLDAAPDGCVYLGLREDCDPARMMAELAVAQGGGRPFEPGEHAARWAAKPHDHFLIPAGTVHCSGRNSMVLEISATPYIFTFKLWDWGRLGLDGRPRPIFLEHGRRNIRWERRARWVERELINTVTPLDSGPGWREERTGLHPTEFIETRRHWFTQTVPHPSHGGVNVLNLVAGWEALVESPEGAFAPMPVHYAETWVMPAAAGAYTVRPVAAAPHTELATMKAFVR